MRTFGFVIIIAALVGLPLTAGAVGFTHVGSMEFAWEGLFTSGRLAALGGSDMADSGPASLLINPAPLGSGDGAGLAYDHVDYISDSYFNTYSGFASQRFWRIGFASEDFVIDPLLLRTAYNPEGAGPTDDTRDRMTLIGLSHIRESRLFHQSIQWSMGATWRRSVRKPVPGPSGLRSHLRNRRHLRGRLHPTGPGGRHLRRLRGTLWKEHGSRLRYQELGSWPDPGSPTTGAVHGKGRPRRHKVRQLLSRDEKTAWGIRASYAY